MPHEARNPKCDYWILGTPEIKIRYRYTQWGGQRFIQANVYVAGWGLLYSAQRETAKAAYQTAQRVVRAFVRHDTVDQEAIRAKLEVQ
jgi:hypothetical protein